MLPAASSFISVSLSLFKVQIIEGRGQCLLSVSPGSESGLQTPQSVETAGPVRAGPDTRGLTCKQQLTPDTGASGAELRSVLTADHTSLRAGDWFSL